MAGKLGSVYRFGDRVAVHVDGETRYIRPTEAVKFANALLGVCESIQRGTFAASSFGTVNFSHEGIHDAN